ncbi:PKD domain-containing protein, partial [Myxococcota bacterium]|nr:PKD domain-containing protein [Myxococcota bacterium]
MRVRVTDGDGAVVEDEVRILVDNLLPTVDLGMDGALPEGSTFTQLASVRDVDQDLVSIEVDYGDGSAHVFMDLPAGGASVPLSHVYRDDGLYTVRITATDQDAAVVSGAITVHVTGVAPIVTASGPAHLSGTGDFALSGFFTDPGADTFVGTVDFGDGAGLEPLSIDPGQTFGANHVYRANGTYTVTVRITDDDGLSGLATTTVLVDGLAPTVVARISGATRAPEGSAIA